MYVLIHISIFFLIKLQDSPGPPYKEYWLFKQSRTEMLEHFECYVYMMLHIITLNLNIFIYLLSPIRFSPMSASGTTVRNWHATEHMETRTIPVTEDTHSASSAMTVTLIMMSCLNICAGTTTSAISVMPMVPRNTTGVCIKPNTQIRCGHLVLMFIILQKYILHFILNAAVNSDYPYLSEHFRESHYLCEEGRCATEQFTHAFRTEIDYKAHKAAAHSKNRAEARQNRQIDLQFNYAPRQQRRNEGLCACERLMSSAYLDCCY